MKTHPTPSSPAFRQKPKTPNQERRTSPPPTVSRVRRKSPPLGEKEICRIVGLRTRHPGIPASRIREIYMDTFGSQLAENTIRRILDSCGMPETVPRTAELAGGIFAETQVNAPNDVWTVEFKSGWHSRSGLPEPIIVRDEFTRFVIAARMLPDSSCATIGSFFDEIFRSNGFPKTICCSKTSPLGSISSSLLGLTKLSARWLALGINLDWKHPGHTRECRWIERPRMQLGYAWRLQNAQERQEELDRWRIDFNSTTQAHLQNKSPAKIYRCKPSHGAPPVFQLEYPGLEPRRVGKGGLFHFKGFTCFLSTALAGWDIALASREDALLDVRFAQVTLGTLDPEKVEFTPAIPI